MLYTQTTLVRGDVVTTKNVLRVNIWLRTDGAPKYLHVLKPQVLVFGGAPVKPLAYSEIYFPTSQVIGFHTLPPTDEPLDYDPNEANRMMQPVEALVGTFVMRGRIRISTQTDIGSSLEVTNPYLPQMPMLRVPMALVSPAQVAFAFP